MSKRSKHRKAIKEHTFRNKANTREISIDMDNELVTVLFMHDGDRTLVVFSLTEAADVLIDHYMAGI